MGYNIPMKVEGRLGLPTREASSAIFSHPDNIGLRIPASEVSAESVDSPVIRNIVFDLLRVAGANVKKEAIPNSRYMVGLHARQLGFGENVMVVVWNANASAKDNPEGWQPLFRAFINPKITEKSDEINFDNPEGCFSVDQNISGIIPRYDSVTLDALEVDLETFISKGEIKVTDVRQQSPNKFISRVIQHEVDHGLGKLFPHHATEDEGALCVITDRDEFFRYRASEKTNISPRLIGEVTAPGTRPLLAEERERLRNNSAPFNN